MCTIVPNAQLSMPISSCGLKDPCLKSQYVNVASPANIQRRISITNYFWYTTDSWHKNQPCHTRTHAKILRTSMDTAGYQRRLSNQTDLTDFQAWIGLATNKHQLISQSIDVPNQFEFYLIPQPMATFERLQLVACLWHK